MVLAMDLLESGEETGNLAMLEVEGSVKLAGWSQSLRTIYLSLGAMNESMRTVKRLVMSMGK
jgi:hypothetical protein